MISGSLTGRIIVLTRSLHQSLTFEQQLIEHGAQVVQMPLIAIVEPRDQGEALRVALQQLDQYEWLVVTSANGAIHVADSLKNTATPPKLAAVGIKTANALGTKVDFIPSIARGDELVAQFPQGNGRVLVVQAEVVDGTVADGLRARGFIVDVVSAYRTEQVTPNADDMEHAVSADAVVFYSGSAVRSWCSAFGDVLPGAVVAIGKPTAAAATEAGMQHVAVAEEPTLDSVLAALCGLFPQPSP
jgi:uroporphyrinogen-III synthase